MAPVAKQYAKQVFPGNGVVMNVIKGTAANPVTIQSEDTTSQIQIQNSGINATSSTQIAMDAPTVSIPQSPNLNPVKTDGSGVFSA